MPPKKKLDFYNDFMNNVVYPVKELSDDKKESILIQLQDIVGRRNVSDKDIDKIIYSNGTESDLRLFTQKDDYLNSVRFQINKDTLLLDNTEVDGAKRVFIRIK